MSTTAAPEPETAPTPFPADWTLADILHHLGDIPPERVMLYPQPGTATEADAIAAVDREPKRLCELIDGILVEKAVGWGVGFVGMRLGILLGQFVLQNDLGRLNGPDGMARFSKQVRLPDVAFYSWDRLGGRERPSDSIGAPIPELAVEVLSKGNTRREMAMKRQVYFGAGVLEVLEVDPKTRTVRAFAGPGEEQSRLLTEADDLTCAALPGFSVKVSELFA